MRPVTKVDPDTFDPEYPYYTDGSLDTDQDFNANSAISRAFTGDTDDGHTMTVREMMQAILNWDHRNVDPFHNNADNADKVAAIRALKDRLAELYRRANPHLSAQLGDYCSYCEIFYPGEELDVEHSIPKSPFPMRTVWWWNFLQCCSRCNSIKGQKPSRALARGWAGGGNPSEPQIMDAARNHYFWPDIDADSYQRLSYELRNAENNYALVPMALAAALTNRLVTFNNYEVQARLRVANNGAVRRRHVEVTVRGVGNPVPPTTTAQLANVGLDRRDSARAGYRTRTWFRVLVHLAPIEQHIQGGWADDRKEESFRMGWALFMLGAQSFGHYSTIVTLLQQFPNPAYMPEPYPTLAERFVHDSDPANANPFTVWPGTDTAQVP